MAEPHVVLDALPRVEARRQLATCCGARRWVDSMLQRWPFGSTAALYEASAQAFAELSRQDYLEAFSHHPRIGAKPAEIRADAGDSAALARGEQAGVASADEVTRTRLRDANAAYADRFGFIFLVCATGKTATEMLELLLERTHHDPATELGIAAAEQAKITRLRLEKLAT